MRALGQDRHLGWGLHWLLSAAPDIPAVAGFLLCTKEREYCKVSQGYHVSSVLLCGKLPGRL